VEEKFDFNDEEEAIRATLEEDEPLPTEILQKIVTPWWKNEPYRRVLEILGNCGLEHITSRPGATERCCLFVYYDVADAELPANRR